MALTAQARERATTQEAAQGVLNAVVVVAVKGADGKVRQCEDETCVRVRAFKPSDLFIPWSLESGTANVIGLADRQVDYTKDPC